MNQVPYFYCFSKILQKTIFWESLEKLFSNGTAKVQNKRLFCKCSLSKVSRCCTIGYICCKSDFTCVLQSYISCLQSQWLQECYCNSITAAFAEYLFSHQALFIVWRCKLSNKKGMFLGYIGLDIQHTVCSCVLHYRFLNFSVGQGIGLYTWQSP